MKLNGRRYRTDNKFNCTAQFMRNVNKERGKKSHCFNNQERTGGFTINEPRAQQGTGESLTRYSIIWARQLDLRGRIPMLKNPPDPYIFNKWADRNLYFSVCTLQCSFQTLVSYIVKIHIWRSILKSGAIMYDSRKKRMMPKIA